MKSEFRERILGKIKNICGVLFNQVEDQVAKQWQGVLSDTLRAALQLSDCILAQNCAVTFHFLGGEFKLRDKTFRGRSTYMQPHSSMKIDLDEPSEVAAVRGRRPDLVVEPLVRISGDASGEHYEKSRILCKSSVVVFTKAQRDQFQKVSAPLLPQPIVEIKGEKSAAVEGERSANPGPGHQPAPKGEKCATKETRCNEASKQSPTTGAPELAAGSTPSSPRTTSPKGGDLLVPPDNSAPASSNPDPTSVAAPKNRTRKAHQANQEPTSTGKRKRTLSSDDGEPGHQRTNRVKVENGSSDHGTAAATGHSRR